jgi:pimeloyl-ACP methyl ester carboxylesterase
MQDSRVREQTRTDDGVILRGSQVDGPDRALAVVIGHGFTNSVSAPDARRLIAVLSRHVGVVALDFRGHGASGGLCSVGDKEVLDLAAGVRLARSAGYQNVATVGFSMGAAVALRHAGLPTVAAAGRPDAVVAVSGPARWWSRESRPMRTVHWLLEQPHGRLVARLVGVRLGGRWDTVPASPVEVVDRIAPTPLLLVHGSRDDFFSVEHARQLRRASGGHAELWIEPGMGHGESATSDELAERIAGWLRRVVTERAAA